VQLLDDADPYETTESGDIATVSGEVLARQRILRALFTEPGEVQHRPSFGGGLNAFRNKTPTPFNFRRLRAQTESTLDSLSFVDEHDVAVRTESEGGTTVFVLDLRVVIDGVELAIPEVSLA